MSNRGRSDRSRGAPPLAVVVAGVAGSGKTTLGRALARSLSLPMLDLDSVTNPLLDRIGEQALGGHWLSGPQAAAVRDGRYDALRTVARDVVATAHGAVLVAPFTAELRGGPAWEALQDAVRPADLRVVQIVGDAELFAARREHRGTSRDLHRRPDAVLAMPRIPVIPVDADLSTDQQLARVHVALGRRRPLDRNNAVFHKQFGAVLFDLDGCLVDSTASVIRSWRRFAREMGLPMQALPDNHGQPARTLLEKLLPAGDVEAGLARITSLEVADALQLRPTVGAAALFDGVPEDRRAVVTSGSRRIALVRLGAAGFTTPRVMVTADDVRSGKPDPEPYLVAARRLGVPPQRCLVVEDAPAGVTSARAAGCEVIAVAGTVPEHDLAAAALVVDALDRVTLHLDGGRLRLRARGAVSARSGSASPTGGTA